MVSALWPQATYCVINIAHSEEPYPLIMPYLAFLFIYLFICGQDWVTYELCLGNICVTVNELIGAVEHTLADGVCRTGS